MMLRIARVPAVAPLSDADGFPVWPCLNDEDEARVRTTARQFGGDVVHVVASAAPVTPAVNQTVVALGADAEPLGRLYAHLTGRRVVVARDVAQALDRESARAIVHLAPSAPYDLLDEIARRKLNARIGVLWAADPDALRGQVLVRSAAMVLSPSVEGRSRLFSPMAGRTTPVSIGPLELRGAADTAEEMDDLADSAVLAFTTHSDGIDAMLGPKLTLCGLKDGSLSQDRTGPEPRCILTRECHRQEMPFDEAMSSNRLVPLDRIGGRVVVWNTCFGVMTARESVGDAWGLLPRLLESPRIGSLVVLRSIVTTGTAAVVPLVDDLHRGRPLGAALATWRSTLAGSPSEIIGDRMFIFGDPDVTANPATDSFPLAEVPTAVDASAGAAAARTDGGLIRRFLADVDPSTAEEVDVVARCLAALEAFERGAADPSRESGEEAAALRSSILEAIVLRHWSLWTDSWQLGVRATRVVPGEPCTSCGAELYAAVYQPEPLGSVPRYYANCGRCGAVDDRPEIDAAVVVFTREGLELREGGPVVDWSGALWTVPSPPKSGWGEWPRDAAGRPVRRGRMPDTPTIGPTFRVGILITGWRVSLFMRRAYLVPGAVQDAGRSMRTLA
jgi:hypothetical protein